MSFDGTKEKKVKKSHMAFRGKRCTFEYQKTTGC